MALVVCRSCGKGISDRAKVCPACGEVLVQENEEKRIILCEDCGTEIPKGASDCPNCGCPVEKEEKEVPQKVEVTAVSIPKKRLMKVFAVLIVVAIVVFAGVKIYHQKQQEELQKQQEELERQKSEMLAKYQANYNLAVISMISGAGDAEEIGNLTKQVWYNTIYKKNDSKTDKYTKKFGYFESDFNTALNRLFSDETVIKQMSDIKDNQLMVSDLMKELINPPAEKEEAYKAIKDLYDAYLAFTNLVISPSGSLQTFSSNFNNLDSEVLNKYNALSLYMN